MMNSSVSTIVYAVFAVLVIGALLLAGFLYDRSRSKEVRRDVPDRVAEGLSDPEARERSSEVLHEDGPAQQTGRDRRHGAA
jgi:hypothetical protein